MYCQTCGIAIAQSMKYCNHCGNLVVTPAEAMDTRKSEKRLDEYLDGLFWITVFGVGLTLGGMVVLKKLLFSDAFIVAFLALSSAAFLINLLLSLWVILGLVKKSKETKALTEALRTDTKELEPTIGPAALRPAPSVTEHTTRSFEPIYVKRPADEN